MKSFNYYFDSLCGWLLHKIWKVPAFELTLNKNYYKPMDTLQEGNSSFYIHHYVLYCKKNGKMVVLPIDIRYYKRSGKIYDHGVEVK